MSLTDLPVFDVLRTSMKWHQTRQRVLAENVANADTPGYAAQDLKRLDFSGVLQAQRAGAVATARTHSAHLAGAQMSAGSQGFDTADDGDFETTPSGNSVVVEEQMMKVAANQMDYQAATTLYMKSVSLLRIALGRDG